MHPTHKSRMHITGGKRQHILHKLFMNKREVRKAADRELMKLEIAGSTVRVTLDQFLEDWYLPVADGRLRPSTAAGYRGVWERYIHGRSEAKKPLWQYRTVDVQKLLGGIAHDHPNLSHPAMPITIARGSPAPTSLSSPLLRQAPRWPRRCSCSARPYVRCGLRRLALRW